jgi:hypothetical protein
MEIAKYLLLKEWLNAPVFLWALVIILGFFIVRSVPIRIVRRSNMKEKETILETNPPKPNRKRKGNRRK